jgi:hypothetical protein
VGRVQPAELLELHGKVFGVARKEWEAWHVDVLEAAAMWALAEQARRLAARLEAMLAARRSQLPLRTHADAGSAEG